MNEQPLNFNDLTYEDLENMSPPEGLAPAQLLYWERERRQMLEILSPDNFWYTGLRIGHPPSPEDAFFHFAGFGGAEDFKRRWEKEITQR